MSTIFASTPSTYTLILPRPGPVALITDTDLPVKVNAAAAPAWVVEMSLPPAYEEPELVVQAPVSAAALC